LALAGIQRWLSLIAGLAILLGLALSSRYTLNGPVTRPVLWLKSNLARFLHRRTMSSLFSLGALNGLLPCGLVYVAGAGAVAAGGFLSGLEYMLAFGLGTWPMMLGLGLAGQPLHGLLRLKLQKVIPACLILLAFLLILRGMSLGIPYLSPDLAQSVRLRP
jgi:uncharacterized protein